jgi:hypothetical protein
MIPGTSQCELHSELQRKIGSWCKPDTRTVESGKRSNSSFPKN